MLITCQNGNWLQVVLKRIIFENISYLNQNNMITNLHSKVLFELAKDRSYCFNCNVISSKALVEINQASKIGLLQGFPIFFNGAPPSKPFSKKIPANVCSFPLYFLRRTLWEPLVYCNSFSFSRYTCSCLPSTHCL